MSAIAFGAAFALFVAVAFVIFESLKSLVLEYGFQQVGKLISWSFNERVTESTSQCFAFDSCEQQSVQQVSLFEREVVWSEQSSYVLHFISPLFDNFLIVGFSAIGLVPICCDISVSQQRDPPASICVPRVSDGGASARYKNPRPIFQRGRGTLA